MVLIISCLLQRNSCTVGGIRVVPQVCGPIGSRAGGDWGRISSLTLPQSAFVDGVGIGRAGGRDDQAPGVGRTKGERRAGGRDRMCYGVALVCFFSPALITYNMSIRDWIFGGGTSESDHGRIDHYRVSHQRNGDGWTPVEGYDDLNEPITEQTFEYNEAPLDPGQYKLFAVKNNLHTQLPDGEGWKLTVEDETADEEESPEELLNELRELVAEQKAEQQQDNDIDHLIEKRKAVFGLQVLQDPAFIDEHGDKLALSVLDVDPDIEPVDQEDELEIEIDQDNPLDELFDTVGETPTEGSETP